MPTAERDPRPAPSTPRDHGTSGLSMRDLLASCAAASAVSTPPARTADRTAADDAPEAGRAAGAEDGLAR